MLNYTKMHFYYIFHSKIIICLLASILLLCLVDSYFLSNTFYLRKTEDLSSMPQVTEERDGTIQITIEIDPNTNEPLPSGKMTIDYVINNILSSSYPFLCVMVFATIYFITEKNSGFIRNISGITYKRRDYYLSKYLTNCIMTGAVVIIFSLFSAIFSPIFYSSGLSIGSVFKTIMIILVQIILLSGISSIIVAITSIIRSKWLCVVCAVSIILQIPLAFIGFLVQAIFSSKPAITSGLLQYLLIDVSDLTLNADALSIFRFVLTGIIYLFISMIITFLFCRKKDFA